MKKTILGILSFLCLGINSELVGQVDVNFSTVVTGGNQRMTTVAIYQNDRSRPNEVNSQNPIKEDALIGSDSRTARITIYDGQQVVPIKASRITTK